MNNFENIMILNNKNIGIGRIELNKSELYIADKANKYSLCVHIYNWKEINKIEIGKRQKIDFNEYCLGENNESALVWPTDVYVEKPTKDSIIFYLKFDDFSDVCSLKTKTKFIL